MQIVITMAGVGKRFQEKGYKLPKPLIEVEGKPIIEHVVNLFPGENEFVFICNNKDLVNTQLKEILTKLKHDAKIIGIDYEKFGPVYGILLAEKAEPFLKDDVIINYCDFYMDWDFEDFRRTIDMTKCEGNVPCYTGFHPHLLHGKLYAGVKVDGNNFMTEIQEKHRFSEDPTQTLHSAGLYYFKKGEYVKKYFKELMDKKMDVNGEYYVSMVYQLLLRDKLPIHVYEIKHFLQWGTPEDFEEYLEWSVAFRKKASDELPDEEWIKLKQQKSFKYWQEFFSNWQAHPYS